MSIGFQGKRLGKEAMYKRNREIARLRDSYGLTSKVIGMRLGLSKTTVDDIYHKVKEQPCQKGEGDVG